MVVIVGMPLVGRTKDIQLRGGIKFRPHPGDNSQDFVAYLPGVLRGALVFIRHAKPVQRRWKWTGRKYPSVRIFSSSCAGSRPAIIGVEVCEDLWVPLAPHEYQALAGATVLINLSASNEILGKADWRRTMISSESGRCIAAYCYVSSGIGESSNDVVFSSHAIIAENGSILKESARLSANPQLIISDIDLERLAHDRACHEQLPRFFRSNENLPDD